MRLEYEHGALATICEDDVINFFGPNTDMEQFIDMAKEFWCKCNNRRKFICSKEIVNTEGI